MPTNPRVAANLQYRSRGARRSARAKKQATDDYVQGTQIPPPASKRWTWKDGGLLRDAREATDGETLLVLNHGLCYQWQLNGGNCTRGDKCKFPHGSIQNHETNKTTPNPALPEGTKCCWECGQAGHIAADCQAGEPAGRQEIKREPQEDPDITRHPKAHPTLAVREEPPEETKETLSTSTMALVLQGYNIL